MRPLTFDNVKVGQTLVCVESLDERLVKGKKYVVEEKHSYTGCIEVTDQNGLWCGGWYPKRFQQGTFTKRKLLLLCG